MADYIIGFRSGGRLVVTVNDGEQLLKDIADGLNKINNVPVQWLSQSGVLLNLSEMTYVAKLADKETEK